MDQTAELSIPRRFRGPARSGNGGYTAGMLASHVPTGSPDPVTVEVTLRQPPPLETVMTVQHRGETTVLTQGDDTVAEARAVVGDLTPVEQVPADVVAAAMAEYAGLRSHPFPECFACGTDRDDGLRIFPGPVAEGVVASLWVPEASLAESGDVLDTGLERVGGGTAWAALDCVGGWSQDMEGRPMVLGRITARVDALPVVGEPHVVVGRLLGAEGRKSFTASTLYDTDGRVVATATHVWITVDPSVFN